MSTVKKSRSGKRVARQQNLSSIEEESKHQLDSQVATVGTISDDVLLVVFDFYLLGSYREDAWMMLAHVCKMWRCIVFASPQRLRLQLLCTNKRPVQNSLDVWPELPIVVKGRRGMTKPQGAKNMVAALKQHSRVCEIDISQVPNTLLTKIRAMEMRDPFPALRFLYLSSYDDNAPALPNSFLGGSAPRLQSLLLLGIPFPGLPKLLLSTRDLVELSYRWIPLSGYISPKAMVAGLSVLTRLQTLHLKFRSPRSRVDRENRLLPRPTRVVLPALTRFLFQGDSEYLEDIVAQIDTPRLDRLQITFFNQLIFDTPCLRHSITRTETLKLPHQAKMTLREYSVVFDLAQQEENSNLESSVLSSSILCRPSDWQLSSLAQICDSALFSLPTVDRLQITSDRENWQDDMDNTQWLEVLNPFTSVKDLILHGNLIPLVALAMEDLIGERVTDVLPALQNLFLWGPQPSESVKKAIGKFIATRQLSGGCSVIVHHRETRNQDYIRWGVSN